MAGENVRSSNTGAAVFYGTGLCAILSGVPQGDLGFRPWLQMARSRAFFLLKSVARSLKSLAPPKGAHVMSSPCHELLPRPVIRICAWVRTMSHDCRQGRA